MTQVTALLAADTGNTLTAHDIANEATWVDKYRAHGGSATALWHYADIEIATGDVSATFFNFPKLTTDQVASKGLLQDCVMHKIYEFQAELIDPNTTPEEKVLALKYILHFVDDDHKRLHS